MSLFFRGPAKHTVVLEAYGWQSIPISLQTMFMLSRGSRLSGLCLEPQEDLHAACKNMTLKGPDVLPLNSGGTCHPWGPLCSTVNFPRCIRICFCEQDHFKLLRSPFSQRGAKGLGEGPWGKKHQVELQEMGQSHPYLSLRLSRAKGAASWNDDYWYGQRKKSSNKERGLWSKLWQAVWILSLISAIIQSNGTSLSPAQLWLHIPRKDSILTAVVSPQDLISWAAWLPAQPGSGISRIYWSDVGSAQPVVMAGWWVLVLPSLSVPQGWPMRNGLSFLHCLRKRGI